MPFAKTSGSKGLQLYVPLNSPVTFEQTKSENFHKRVAAVLSAQKREQLGNWNEHFEAARER